MAFNPLSIGQVLLVGVEDDKDGSVRAYIGARYTGVHTHISDRQDIEAIKRAWANPMQHIYITEPAPEALCDCGGAR